MATEICIIDLDGTLSKYPGSDFRSLFTKYLEFESKCKNIKTSAKFSAEIMINRYNKDELETIKNNVKYLHSKYGQLLILSLNYKAVAVKYLKMLDVIDFFNIDKSKFREDLSDNPRKEDIWMSIVQKYKKILYIDDDLSILKSLKKMASFGVSYIHMDDTWMGNINIEDYIKKSLSSSAF